MKLEDIEKKNIFNVPDGYFEGLPSKIQQRALASTHPKNAWSFLSINQSVRWAVPSLAFAGLLIWVVIQFLKPTQIDISSQQTVEQQLSGISEEEISKYLLENGIDESLLMEYTCCEIQLEEDHLPESNELLESQLDFNTVL